MTIPTFLATPSFMEGLMLLLTCQRGTLTGPEPQAGPCETGADSSLAFSPSRCDHLRTLPLQCLRR